MSSATYPRKTKPEEVERILAENARIGAEIAARREASRPKVRRPKSESKWFRYKRKKPLRAVRELGARAVNDGAPKPASA